MIKKIEMSDEEIELLKKPRPDMQEPAFRRYERFIAEGCKGSYVMNARKEVGVSSSTFKTRFADAKRGFVLYDYESTVIPKEYELSRVKVVVLDSERVKVENKYEEQRKRLREFNRINKDAWAWEEGEKWMTKRGVPRDVKPVTSAYEAREWLAKLNSGEINGWEVLVIVLGTADVLAESRKEFPNTRWEEVRTNHWMVINSADL